MLHTIDEQLFREALEKKDAEKIKQYVKIAIRNNPRFSKNINGIKSEASYIIDELQLSFNEIFDDYHVQPNEVEFDNSMKDSWNEEYFYRQLNLFITRNFAKERYKHLIAISNKIYLPSNFEEPQEIKTQAAKKPLPVKAILVATATVALVALVAIIVVKTLQ